MYLKYRIALPPARMAYAYCLHARPDGHLRPALPYIRLRRMLGQARHAPKNFAGIDPPRRPAGRRAGMSIATRLQIFLLLGGSLLLSFHLLRFGSVNVTVSDVLLVCAVLLAMSRHRLSRHPFGSMSQLWFLCVLGFLGALLVSSVANYGPGRWLVVAPQYIWSLIVIPMLFGSLDRAFLQRCLFYFAYGVVLSQIIGLGTKYVLPGLITNLLPADIVLGNNRLGAMTGEGNWNGAMIAFASAIILYGLIERRMNAIFALVCLGILAWALLETASVTGFSATLIGVLVLLIGRGGKALLFWLLPLTVLPVAYVSLGLPLPEIFETRVAGALSSGNIEQAGTFSARADLIGEAWEIADDTVILGIGVDQYRVLSSDGAPVHNFPLLILTEGGFLAFVCLVGLFLIMATIGLRRMGQDRSSGALILALVTVLAVFSMAIPHMYTRIWFAPPLLALIAFAPQIRRPAHSLQERRRQAHLRNLGPVEA